MAQRVEAFPTQSKYPWGKWLDGSVWELVIGEDYKANPRTLRRVATAQAKKRDGTVRTRLIRAQDGASDRMYIQFIAPTRGVVRTSASSGSKVPRSSSPSAAGGRD